jgi:Sulfatase
MAAMTDNRIDRTRLPVADPKCVGMANRTLQGSRPDWGLIGHVAPPEGAPDVLVVLIDDAGFGNPSTFGGPISTLSMSRMAEEGIRYNGFHVTALCSPTRAPFAFIRTIKKVTIDIKPHLSAADEQALHESAHHGHVAHSISG